MSELTKAQMKAKLDGIYTTNGNKEITGALANEMLTDFIDSFFALIDNGGDTGFIEYKIDKAYLANELTYFDGNLYISREDQTAGGFTAAKWVKMSNRTGASSFLSLDFVQYESSTIYNIGDLVIDRHRYFICDVNGTVGIQPIGTAAEWSEVYAHNGDRTLNWQAGYYIHNQVVQFGSKYWILIASTPSNAFVSTTDPATDSGNWDQFNPSSGATGPEFWTPRFDNVGNLVPSQELTQSPGKASVKTLLELLTTSEITKVNEDGSVLRKAGTTLGIVFSPDEGMYITGGGPAFNKGWAGADNNGAGIGWGADYVNIDSAGRWNFTAGGFLCELIKTAITAPRNYTWPNKSGTIAMTSDIPSPIFNVPQLFNEFNVPAPVLLAPGGAILQSYNPSIPGNYYVEVSSTAEITGDESATVIVRVNGVNQPGGLRTVSNNQGGGAVRSVDNSVHIVTTAFAIGAPTEFIEFYAQSAGLGGTISLKQSVVKVFKLS